MLEGDTPTTRMRGWAILDSVSRMRGLSADDALLVDGLLSTREPAAQLEEARRVEELTRGHIVFYVDSDEHGVDDDLEEES